MYASCCLLSAHVRELLQADALCSRNAPARAKALWFADRKAARAQRSFPAARCHLACRWPIQRIFWWGWDQGKKQIRGIERWPLCSRTRWSELPLACSLQELLIFFTKGRNKTVESSCGLTMPNKVFWTRTQVKFSRSLAYGAPSTKSGGMRWKTGGINKCGMFLSSPAQLWCCQNPKA